MFFVREVLRHLATIAVVIRSLLSADLRVQAGGSGVVRHGVTVVSAEVVPDPLVVPVLVEDPRVQRGVIRRVSRIKKDPGGVDVVRIPGLGVHYPRVQVRLSQRLGRIEVRSGLEDVPERSRIR